MTPLRAAGDNFTQLALGSGIGTTLPGTMVIFPAGTETAGRLRTANSDSNLVILTLDKDNGASGPTGIIGCFNFFASGSTAGMVTGRGTLTVALDSRARSLSIRATAATRLLAPTQH